MKNRRNPTATHKTLCKVSYCYVSILAKKYPHTEPTRFVNGGKSKPRNTVYRQSETKQPQEANKQMNNMRFTINFHCAKATTTK